MQWYGQLRKERYSEAANNDVKNWDKNFKNFVILKEKAQKSLLLTARVISIYTVY